MVGLRLGSAVCEVQCRPLGVPSSVRFALASLMCWDYSSPYNRIPPTLREYSFRFPTHADAPCDRRTALPGS